ncbi:MAG: AEC family transporter [Chthoniobacterales bacterium]
MNTQYLQLLGLVAPVYLIIVTGFAVRRLGWLNAAADASLLRLVVNLLIPCLILDSILGNPSLARVENLILPPVIGFASIIIGFAVARLVSPWLGHDLRMRRTFAFTTGIYNYSYLALPLVVSLFNRATLGVLFTFNLGVEIAFWTVGLIVLTGSENKAGPGWRRVVNPPILSIVFAVILNAIVRPEWLPHFLTSGIHTVGGIAIPLALLLTGATMADWIPSLKTGFRTPLVALAIGLRLGVLPVLFLLAARWLPMSLELQRIIVIQAAMPAGMLPVVIAKHYDGDPGAALQVVIGTSVIGLLTIPFWIRVGLPLVGL